MPAQKSAVRVAFEERVLAGESYNAVAAELGVDRRKAYQWDKALHPPTNDAEPPTARGVTNVEAPAKNAGGKAKRPITEETAGKLCEGIFLAVAIVNHEPLWLLDDAEKKELAGPAADSLAMLPNPIADAINTYATPGVFLTAIIAIVNHKRALIANKGRGPRGVAPAPQATRPAAQAPPAAESPAASPAQESPMTAADLAAAAANAAAGSRGTLTDLDEQDPAERELS